MTSVPALGNGWQIPFSFVWSLRLVQYFEGDNLFYQKKLTRFSGRTERVGNVSMLWQVSNNTWLVLMQQFFLHRTLRSEANPESLTVLQLMKNCHAQECGRKDIKLAV